MQYILNEDDIQRIQSLNTVTISKHGIEAHGYWYPWERLDEIRADMNTVDVAPHVPTQITIRGSFPR